MPTQAEELARREQLWAALAGEGGPADVPPQVLHELGIYRGARGIYADLERTRGLGPEGSGATVSVLHTGRHYPDDLSTDGVIYHYPVTAVPGRDAAEVEATKALLGLALPLFVIVPSPASQSRRDVYRGWVDDWSDEAQCFLIAFREQPDPIPPPELIEEEHFALTSPVPAAELAMVTPRPGQLRFKMATFDRYGVACVACGLSVPELLDAAHIRDRRNQGSNDPRNGLVLCALHHRAFDRDLFAIDPKTTAFHPRSTTSLEKLRVTNSDLSHLPRRPHPDALSWRWTQWLGESGQAP